MKRLGLFMLAIMTLSMVYGQRNNRTTAFNYLRNGELDKAMEYIDKTIDHPQTMEDPRTWFYRGNIYLSIYMSDNPDYKNLSDDALDIAYESYTKAKELDTRKQYYTDIITNLFIISEQYYNVGVINYNEGEFKKAISAFENSMHASEMLGSIDTMAVYNIAITAEIAKEYDIAKHYYSRLIDMEFDSPDLYTGLGRLHMAQGDTTTALNYILKGREFFPEDFNLLINEINIYLLSNHVEKAVGQLEKAMEKDDTNPTIFFAVGVAYDQLRSEQPDKSDEFFSKTEKAYERAIELNPNYFDAHYNLGALYVNAAAILIEEANKLPLSAEKKFNDMISQANEFLTKSMPRLETALEVQPDDFNSMVSLKEIYTRLNKFDKLKEIDQRIKEHQQKN